MTAPAWLPLTLLAVPLAFAVPAAFARARPAKALWVAGSAVALGLAVALARAVLLGGPIGAMGGEIRADALGALMSLLVAFIGLACSIYALSYLPGHHESDPERQARLTRRLPMFASLFLVLETTLFWCALTNDIVLLWVALEATTLASALLVAFYWDRRALEAGYKYLLLLTVGITAALFGCVLLYSAAAPHLGSENALLITQLRRVAPLIPPHIAGLALLLLLIGFGTKAGLAPFHPWVADAHAEAPAVMSAFLSGIIIKAPFIALFRIWSIFAPLYPEVGTTLLWVGGFTMVTGAVLALAQDDLKRLHAYSSVSQMGYIAVALGLGDPLGAYAALFFLVSHALTKGLLFLATGSVVYATGEIRNVTALGGLRARMPFTATCALIAALSLAGMPPFGGFLAKAQVVLAAAAAQRWTVMAVALGVSLFTMAYMIRMIGQVFRAPPVAGGVLALECVHEAPGSMRLAMGLLAAAILGLGLLPWWIHPLLERASVM